MTGTTLVIGNKNYSSWSLRAWLALRKSGASFEELRLPLDTAEFASSIGRYSPSGRVPVLRDGERVIWDSLAICEYANERWADGALWPADAGQRALARSLSAEMHSGFPQLRQKMPMNCRAVDRFVPMEDSLQAEVERIISAWCECRDACRDAGPWLFGNFSLADAMFAPVALRFHTYGVEIPDVVHNYVETVLHDYDVSEWIAAAREEIEVVEADEAGI